MISVGNIEIGILNEYFSCEKEVGKGFLQGS